MRKLGLELETREARASASRRVGRVDAPDGRGGGVRWRGAMTDVWGRAESNGAGGERKYAVDCDTWGWGDEANASQRAEFMQSEVWMISHAAELQVLRKRADWQLAAIWRDAIGGRRHVQRALLAHKTPIIFTCEIH